MVVIDGMFGRAAWTGRFQQFVDRLPLSGCQTMALTPYLLEQVGFQIEAVQLMKQTNSTASDGGSSLYVVVARKPTEPVAAADGGGM